VPHLDVLRSVDEKETVFNFLMASHTLMVILLIISAALQFSTIALSTGCPCGLAIMPVFGSPFRIVPCCNVDSKLLSQRCLCLHVTH
jgi:hypothetical protein